MRVFVITCAVLQNLPIPSAALQNLLWTKVQGRKDITWDTVLQNQIHHLQAVTQAIADDVCWKRILDELVTNDSMARESKQQQVTYLDAQLATTLLALRTATTEAREYALL